VAQRVAEYNVVEPVAHYIEAQFVGNAVHVPAAVITYPVEQYWHKSVEDAAAKATVAPAA